MNVSKRIKFFSFYGCLDQGKRRNNSPAADTKIDYIVSVLNRLGYGVDVVSRASSSESFFLPSSIVAKGPNNFRYFASFGNTVSPLRVVYRWLMELQFFLWCFLNLKRGEQVIVYHSLGYDAAFIKLQKIKSICIIGEIEEIYQDVRSQSTKRSRNEFKFIEACEKYIFPTQLIDQKLNGTHKPSLVIHGVYSKENVTGKSFSDGKIHVVYGGTLDPNKGGAAAAAAAAEYLPSNYHVHICGFGDSRDIKAIIDDVQSRSKSTVTFEGELIGDSYKAFIQKCDIGLSTQNPEAAFNDTSFPSKVLVYLSNGLKVVSVSIPVVSQSAVADYLYFYDDQTPEKIAEAIIRASTEEKSKDDDILNDLDRQFGVDLELLIEG